MPGIDIFNDDAFSVTSLLTAVDKVGYVPGSLGSIPGLFEPAPVRSEAIWIEARGTDAALIQTSARGEAPAAKGDSRRTATPFATKRLAQGSRITSSELAGIREFGTENVLRQVQTEVARRQFLLKRDMDLTFENWRLGCIQGIVTDADGSTIVDWATALGQTIPAEVDFDLDNANPASGALRKKCAVAVRSMSRGLKGLGGNSVTFMALCDDTSWDDLIAHPEVRETYLGQQEAAQLRGASAWESFNFGGITWMNYRGTDDNSTVAIGAGKIKMFPVGAGIFKWAMSPGEQFEHIGQLGQMFYPGIVTDKDRNMWADVELYAYPLPVCVMPQALYRGRNT
ncbi:major capsid protein [Mesorhizobium sp.]|uniref:major capsid protein n=1 Tax=Mesorhizobium sp. TaxID=1871066 RepID=UPI000FE33F3B|nr:major capsid protein [Mesorhizobium sp.]RWQ12347.1 MAG: major capsid protein [Mesorhizobium sp.]